ncbi:stearoyl-CoA 9-desaturase [Carbonactinospora thermoautotrophica]|nr:stearoyl-CoA 9-desaturase [Carbonactinospora thermoautotrophica]
MIRSSRTPFRVARRLFLQTTGWLTTPLLPEDYLGLMNPLWSVRELRGRVEAVRRETADAATLVIRPGWGWTGHLPGQYVRVGVEIGGVLHWRTYSLTSPAGRQAGHISITVKAIPGGRVSRHLVYRTTPGTLLRLGVAQGEFVLTDPVPPRLLFWTAGSGITPVMGMLRTLAARGAMPDVVLVHSAPTPQDVIFGAELRDLARRFATLRLYEHYTRAPGSRGRLSVARVPELCPDWRERAAWACGPAGMLDEVERHWAGAGIADRLRVERFRPAVAATDGGGGRVRFTKTGREVDADGATPLLILGENAGVAMPSGCRMGICFGCVAPLRYGQVRDLRTGRVHGEEGDLVQTCVSAAAGPVEIEL